ncbi:MAG: PspC domain-containing protein [Nanoarchaeota archaeon]|nr:PspC domain-containing protein [Nanoarchaeota archaeon]
MVKSKIKRLYRASEKDSMIGGVCAGIADYSGLDSAVVRILWIVLTAMTVGTGILAYLICWVIIPRK